MTLILLRLESYPPPLISVFCLDQVWQLVGDRIVASIHISLPQHDGQDPMKVLNKTQVPYLLIGKLDVYKICLVKCHTISSCTTKLVVFTL